MHSRCRRTVSGWIMTGLTGTALLGSAVKAQEATARPSIRIGFHRGESFQIGPRRTRLEGFELGADVPLRRSTIDGAGVYFSPTVTFGGSNRKGADTDGNIYRLLVSAKSRLGTSGAYGGLGAGYSFTQARIHEFRNVQGLAAELILGYDFRTPARGSTQPFLEAAYHKGAHSQLSGVSVDAGIRL